MAFVALAKLAGILHKAGNRFFRAYGLTQAQFNILFLLNYELNEGCSQRDLCEKVLVRPANMSGLLRRMQRERLLRRSPHPHDERARLVTISPKGRRLLTVVEPAYYRTVQRLMGVYSQRQLERIPALLKKTQRGLAELKN